jgi:CelD/BcsL family acetyltransferase involved in cellulose biosynthesis
VHFSALTLDDRILATLWGLVYKGRFYHLFPTYARGELTRYSPGNSLLRRVFEWCFANTVRIFDFTIGDEAYKYDWCDQELRLFDFIYATTTRVVLRRICLAGAP